MVMRMALLALLVSGCAARGPWVTGQASWYGPGFAGKPTASGERFVPARLTAAHKELPFGTVLRVERLSDGRTVRVVVNDRGPFSPGRVLDLAKGAARRLHMLDDGVVQVRYRTIGCKKRYTGRRSCGAVRT